MVAPLPCEKPELCRGLGAKTSASRRVAAARALAASLALCALAVGVSAGPAGEPHRDLLVSSTLERITAPADGAPGSPDVAAPVAPAEGPLSHADQLIVSVRFTNAGERVLDSLRITSPVPADLSYVAGSANGPGSDVLFSVDGGHTFGRPQELAVPAATGGQRAADAADYTHVRWIFRAPLDAGASGVARFRAVPR